MTNPYAASGAAALPAHAATATQVPHLIAAHGRIGRVRYLAYTLAIALLACAGTIASPFVAIATPTWAFLLAVGSPLFFLAMSFNLGRRRLNDMGRNGWPALALLVPLLNLGLFAWLACASGEPADNAWGLPPADNPWYIVASAIALPVCVLGALPLLLDPRLLGAFQ